MKQHLPFIFTIVLFSSFGLKALLHPGLFTAHDIWHQVARFYHYYQALLDGQYPPYWIDTLANGFGYPLFFFSYHLPWIVGAPLLFFGLDIPTTIKILFFLSYLFSGIFMYLFSFDLFKDKFAACLLSILYLWAPYHFSTILVGAALGTAFVFTFLPLLLWGMNKVANRQNTSGTILVALGTAGIILSHLITVISLIPLVGIFGLWLVIQSPDKFKLIKRLCAAFILGLSLASFYFLPAIFYAKETQAPTGTFSELYKKQFVDIKQLIYSKWGYGISDRAKDGVISYQIGIAQWLSFLGSLTVLLLKRIGKFHLLKTKLLSKKILPQSQILGISFLFLFVISVLMMLDISKPIWDFGARFITLDYPTMFLLTSVTAGSLLSGWLLTAFGKKVKSIIFIILLLVVFYTNRNHLRVNMYTNNPVELYVSSEITTNSYHEYLPSAADIKLFDEPHPSFTIPQLPLAEIKRSTQMTSFSIVIKEPTEIILNHFSFPGITLFVNREKEHFWLDERGRIKFSIGPGIHDIRVSFRQTPLLKFSKLITIGALIYLIFLTAKLYVKKA